VLKISIEEDAAAAALKIEGKLVGPWAIELGRTWQDLWSSTKQKRLLLDIRGLTFADRTGCQILGEIVRTAGAEIIANSPLTQYFANQATTGTAASEEEK
jgi:anti-anti-sigma regulatory factor